MPLIFTREIAADKHEVSSILYMPELLTDEEKVGGIEVKEVPQPEMKPGKAALLFYKPSTKSFFYEYVDRPLTPEEELAQVKEEQKMMQQALDELIFGGIA